MFHTLQVRDVVVVVCPNIDNQHVMLLERHGFLLLIAGKNRTGYYNICRDKRTGVNMWLANEY